MTQNDEIKITRSVYNGIIAHSKALSPIEACGYLGGKDGVITRQFEMKNIDNAEDHFTFDPKEQFGVVKAARNEGLSLMSVYHSHPESPARLSEEDVRLLNDPNITYIIVSLMEKKPDVKAYRLQKPSEQNIEIYRINIKIIT